MEQVSGRLNEGATFEGLLGEENRGLSQYVAGLVDRQPEPFPTPGIVPPPEYHAPAYIEQQPIIPSVRRVSEEKLFDTVKRFEESKGELDNPLTRGQIMKKLGISAEQAATYDEDFIRDVVDNIMVAEDREQAIKEARDMFGVKKEHSLGR